MKRFSLAIIAALLVVTNAHACDIDAAKTDASEAQNYARRAAFAGEAARETEDADDRAADIQDAIESARRAETISDDLISQLEECE